MILCRNLIFNMHTAVQRAAVTIALIAIGILPGIVYTLASACY